MARGRGDINGAGLDRLHLTVMAGQAMKIRQQAIADAAAKNIGVLG